MKESWIIPKTLQLELSTYCPLRCVYCARQHSGGRAFVRPEMFMLREQAERLILTAKSFGVRAVRIFFMGESSIYPDLLGLLQFIKSNGMAIYFATNMFRVEGALADWIIDNFVGQYDYFGISLSSVHRDLWTRISQVDGKVFDRMLRNIKYFLGHCPIKEGKASFVYVQKVTMEMNDNEEEEKAFQEFFARWKNKLRFISLNYGHGFGAKAEMYVRRDAAKASRCKALYDTLTVLSSGAVALCPVDYNGSFDLGNAFDEEQNILALHNSDKMNFYRENYPYGICKDCEIQNLC